VFNDKETHFAIAIRQSQTKINYTLFLFQVASTTSPHRSPLHFANKIWSFK